MSASLTVVISLPPDIDDHGSTGLSDHERSLADEILGELREQLLTLPDITSVHERHQPAPDHPTLGDPAGGLITALSVLSVSTPVGVAAIVSLDNAHQKRLGKRRFVIELTVDEGTRTTRVETEGLGPSAIENAVRRAIHAAQSAAPAAEQPTELPAEQRTSDDPDTTEPSPETPPRQQRPHSESKHHRRRPGRRR